MYIVIEIQLNEGKIGTFVWSYESRNEAEAKYHSVLAAAAVSEIEKHSAVLMAENGINIKNESYFHFTEEESE